MYQRISKPLLSHSFFLFGARGTGKTQLLSTLFPDREKVLWIDLLKQGEFLAFTRSASELRARIDGRTTPTEFVVIDEVQRVPNLLNEVHSLIEERGQKFALTGSSARKLKRGSANLLAGRALLNSLFPLSFIEMGATFSLVDTLNWGSLPAVVNEHQPEVRGAILRTYVDVYLREEVREEQLVRSLDPFARFLDAAAQSNGNILNFSKIGREAGTDSKGVARYFQILEDTLLGFFLEPFHQSLRKRQRQQAKFYLFDTGVKRALEGSLRSIVVPQTYEWGRAFEHLVILEIFRLNHYWQADYKLSYLKTQSQLEIDLIAERRGSKTWAIEIKSAAEVDLTEIRKLKSLAQAIPNSYPVVLCTTAHRKVIDGVTIIPWQEGIKELFDYAS